MASTINATSTGSGGLITTGNSVNQLELQTGDTTRLVIDGSGNVTIQGQGDLRLADSDSSHYVALQAAGSMASNVTFTLPSVDGTNGQLLQTNGSGVLSFATVSAPTPLSLAATTTVAAAATTTINCALGSVFNITWGASIATLSFTNVPASPQATQLVLVFKKDTNVNQYNIVWPSSIFWENNTTPETNVTPNTVITVTLTTIDGGTKWRGSFQAIQGYAGALWGWGSNTKVQLGNGTNTNRSSPVQIGSLATWVGISSFVAGGNEGSFAITSDGVINGAGTGTTVFGMPPNTFSNGPFSSMVPVASGLRAYAIEGCANTAIAIDMNGKLYGWGASASLGLGIDNNSGTSLINAPVIINSGTWIDISGGVENSYAIRSDGTLWATGRNAEGQLGQGDTTARYVWVQVGTGTTWSSVASGTEADCGVLSLRTDGTLWSFGNNGSGQLGLGNTVNRSSPVQIGTDTDWVQISASGASSAAIKSNGTLWTWGLNSSGQLGLGNIVDRSSPVQVGALTDWRQVCMSTISGYAIKTNGTLWAWGNATGGALGDGVVVSRSSPVQIGAATDWLWLPKRGAGSYMHCIRGTATNP
jgi:alpha-tubulin suppressor-like RCC1 family protein